MSIKKHYFEFRNALSKNETKKAIEEFEKAYNKAIDLFSKKLSNNEKFNLNDEEELFSVVVLTDNIIGLWREGMLEEGISFCESMIDLVDSSKLKEMFKGYSLGMNAKIDVDTFFKEYLDLSKIDKEYPQFLCNFKEKIKELI